MLTVGILPVAYNYYTMSKQRRRRVNVEGETEQPVKEATT
jgi:hypothetical protein